MTFDSSDRTRDGRAAIVTGGSQGIGLGIAMALVKANISVLITGRESGPLEHARKQLGDLPTDARVVAVTADGKASGTAARVVDRAIAEFRRLDVLVNNAQEAGPAAAVEDFDSSDVYPAFESGLFATWRYMAAAFPHLRETRGTVVNLGSGAAVPGAGFAAYLSNKEAIRGLTRVAAREWGPDGVTVNVINPAVRTRNVAAIPEDQVQHMVDSIPLKRFGDGELNVGGAVLFLASEAGSFTTGSTLDVDGGAFMRP